MKILIDIDHKGLNDMEDRSIAAGEIENMVRNALRNEGLENFCDVEVLSDPSEVVL